MFDLNFSGKVVLVTGASRGIGKAVAAEFASLGAFVVGTATSESGAERISAELQDKGCGLVFNGLNADSVKALVPAVKEKAGKAPDILINNAGITRDGLFLRMKEADWDAVLACNLTAAARVAQACLQPMLKQRWGRIINISSITGEIGNAGQCNYAAAKAGLIGFSKSLAKEAAPRGITVNCIAPGFIETDMTAVLNPEQLEQWIKGIPLRRAGQARDIAGAAVFLASDLASYITGATIDVNGGLHCA